MMSYRDVASKLRRAGFICERTNKHDVYVHKEKNITIPLPHHPSDIPRGTLRTIIRETGLSPETFMSL